MPPKSRQTKLPRRNAARQGEMDLEAAAEERIDAITAEPLVPNHYVEILSPDRTLRLFYNISTLVRVANDKGGFMQPPHFREPMHASLVAKIEEIEGKRFRFEKRDTFVSSYEGTDATDGRASQTGGLLIHHRHVYFDQIIDEFYHLNPAEVYVCPVCYEHFVNTRYVPYLVGSGARVDRVGNDENEPPVVDPLDVLCYMLGGAVDVDEIDNETADADWDNPLAHLVFRRANDWKHHMRRHHEVTGTPAADYRLRDVLCTYHNHYNRLMDSRYEEKVKRYGDAPRKLALTQQRYWQLNARYNCLRYNRVVEAAERAEGHREAVEQTAFPGETIAQELNPTASAEVDSDFIVDDDDTGSCSGSSDGGYFPRFEGASLDTDDTTTSCDESSDTARARKKRRKEKHGATEVKSSTRKKKRPLSEPSDSGSYESESESAATSRDDGDDETSASDASDVESDRVVRKRISEQRTLFNRGLLKETDCYYQRLSAEDRNFVAHASRQTYTPSRLYDPILHRPRDGANSADDARFQDIEWDQIGEDLTPATKRGREDTVPTEDTPAEPPERDSARGQPRLLLDDEEEAEGTKMEQEQLRKGKADTASSTQPSLPTQLLLLDDE